MLTRDILLEELEQVSDPILAEVLDFVRFLKARSMHEKYASALISEKQLAKDWLRPEEDHAWADL